MEGHTKGLICKYANLNDMTNNLDSSVISGPVASLSAGCARKNTYVQFYKDDLPVTTADLILIYTGMTVT